MYIIRKELNNEVVGSYDSVNSFEESKGIKIVYIYSKEEKVFMIDDNGSVYSSTITPISNRLEFMKIIGV